MAVVATLRSVSAGPDGTAIPEPSTAALRQIGVSRKRWNGLDTEQRLSLLLDRVTRDKEKAAALRHLPQEPFHNPEQDAPVVWFTKTYGGTGSYEYAAIHVHGRGWLITSQQRLGHLPWTGVLQFAMLREAVDFDPKFHVAGEWTPLPKSE